MSRDAICDKMEASRRVLRVPDAPQSEIPPSAAGHFRNWGPYPEDTDV